jgi:hypothetical protein
MLIVFTACNNNINLDCTFCDLEQFSTLENVIVKKQDVLELGRWCLSPLPALDFCTLCTAITRRIPASSDIWY